MTEIAGQGLLAEVTNHFNEKGWGLDTLNSFRMEMNAGDLGGQGTAGSNPGGESEGSSGGGQPSQGGGLSDFGNPFLNEVDPAHKAIVEPYLKKWDGAVTQKFQELHAQYDPYKQLGDVDQLQQAMFISQLLENDPQQVFNFLAQELGVQIDGAQGPGQQQQQSNEFEIPEEFGDLPPAFVQQFMQQQQALEAIASLMLGQQQSAQEQAEDAELDQLMTSLQEQFGDFDEEYVLAKMLTGMNPQQAVQAYHQAVQNALNQRGGGGPQFPVLGGGGVTPQTNSKNVTELSRGQTKDLVAQVLAMSNQQS